MAVYDLEEQEKIEDLKAWWAQYGKYVSAVVTGIAIVVSEAGSNPPPARSNSR
jgi:predicted negative regulator of RcsB-dependent stress response